MSIFKRTFLLVIIALAFFRGAFLCQAEEFKAPLSERVELDRGKRILNDEGASNFKIGPVSFALAAGLNQQYSDNIGLAENNAEEDFITAPTLGLSASWPITSLNGLYLSIGMSYLKYWDHPELDTDSILLDPNTKGEFDFYVGEVHFNVSNSSTIAQDATTVSQLSRVASFRRLTNVMAINADWDLNLFILNSGYSYTRFLSLEDQFSSLDSASHALNASAGFRMSEAWTLGGRVNYGFSEYEGSEQNGNDAYGVGVFSNHTLTSYLRATAEASYTALLFDQGGSINDNNDFGSATYSFSLHNQLNRWLTHSTEFRRFVTAGIGSNFSDIQEMSYQASLDLIRNVSSSIGFSYQWLKDSSSNTSENAQHYSVNLRMGYQLMTKTSLGFGYTHTGKDSETIGRDYEQNRVSVDINHQF